LYHWNILKKLQFRIANTIALTSLLFENQVDADCGTVDFRPFILSSIPLLTAFKKVFEMKKMYIEPVFQAAL
jgi:hypothetical protein